MPENPVKQAAKLLADAAGAVVFTGAGVSTESGIPDFRSPGGVWSRYKPVLYQEFIASAEARKLYWRMKYEGYPDFVKSQPNAAHLALVEIEKMGKLLGIITQNIDGLHHEAGNSPEKIIELHGNNRRVVCLSCGRMLPMEEVIQRIDAGEEAPECTDCGGYLKPATVSFGQAMPEKEMMMAHRCAAACDIFIAVGSSLVVEPAASFPVIAKRNGAALILINLTATPLDPIANIVLHGKAGEILPAVVKNAKLSTNCMN
ncbi:MAG: NAD-dependent deacylase [bacterium]